MITVYLTKNFGGFQVEGDFGDLDRFYDDLGSVVGFKEAQDDDVELQRLLILGLMYEIRHAYQGDRIVKINNKAFDMNDSKEMQRAAASGARFAFNYPLIDFLADYIIIRPQLFPVKKSTYGIKYEDLKSAHYRIVGVFAQAIEQLAAILTPIQINKAKRFLDAAVRERFTLYHGIWLEVISTDYLKMTPSQRKKNLVQSISMLCEASRYDDFYDMRRSVDDYAERNHCEVKDVHKIKDSDYADILW